MDNRNPRTDHSHRFDSFSEVWLPKQEGQRRKQHFGCRFAERPVRAVPACAIEQQAMDEHPFTWWMSYLLFGFFTLGDFGMKHHIIQSPFIICMLTCHFLFHRGHLRIENVPREPITLGPPFNHVQSWVLRSNKPKNQMPKVALIQEISSPPLPYIQLVGTLAS